MKTIEKIGVTSDMDEFEVAECIRKYYFDNIPYTLRPGSTPIRRDFVNYFLDSNKKGYCVHFASAGVLLLRYMGIPARYVEGYAFDYMDIQSATKLDDLDSKDFYKGYNSLGEAPVISVEVSDASAHAWIEMYTDEYGWVRVELTPPSSDIETGTSTLWDRLLNLFNSGNQPSDTGDDTESKKVDTQKIRRNLIIFVAVAVSLILLYYIYRLLSAIIKYRKADINTKLIMRYHRFIKAISNKHDLKQAYNYKDQICAVESDEDMTKLISLLEKAGFSDKEITAEEFDYCMKQMKMLKKKRGSKK